MEKRRIVGDVWNDGQRNQTAVDRCCKAIPHSHNHNPAWLRGIRPSLRTSRSTASAQSVFKSLDFALEFHEPQLAADRNVMEVFQFLKAFL